MVFCGLLQKGNIKKNYKSAATRSKVPDEVLLPTDAARRDKSRSTLQMNRFTQKAEWLLAVFVKQYGYIVVGVFIFSFLFTLFFGNYPQWQDNAYHQALKQYFEPELQHVTFNGMNTSQQVIKLIFTYSDGADLATTNYLRPHKQELKAEWKATMLNLVCVHDDLRKQLQKGRKIDIDLRDGNSQSRVSMITNMVITNGRC